MAKKKGLQNTSSVETRSFTKGMVKDVNQTLMSEGAYLSARNAVNNSVSGDLGVLGNETSNKFCINAPYTVIGTVHLYGDLWAIFSTDDIDSEIGLFDESACSYTPVVNDKCLNFKKTNPIIGQAKENFDCTWEVYWADALNPDRHININKPPFIQNCQTVNDCIICTDTTQLDCDRLRMARLTKMPCIKLEKGPNGGEILNGTYQAVIGYTENEQRITDYSIPSNIISTFDHANVNGSLDVIIEDIDQTYDEFELVIIGFVNQQLVARRMGIYSTHQKRISIDRIDPAANVAIPIQLIPLDKPSYEKSEGIYKNGDYLIRVAPSSRFSFNYQPLANQIKTQWVSVEYPADYYRKSGTNVGYMRDEVYSFFIRWVYNTLDKSESYHIPGRAPNSNEDINFFFEDHDTANLIPASGTTSDGGIIRAKGNMGYWESTEIYPDNKPEIWDQLCGKKIRHHKMPSNTVTNHYTQGGQNINVLGVQFENIQYPLDNQGNPIPGIIGYEILRGSREGNKTIIAKGLINNMGSYTREDNGQIAYYQNYPYNDLRPDPYLSNILLNSDTNNIGNELNGYSQQTKFTFHSPDTQFKHPYLSSKTLRVYNTQYGKVNGVFVEPYKHPKHKIITDLSFILSALVGFGLALKAIKGTKKTTLVTPHNTNIEFLPFAGIGSSGPGTTPGAAAAAVAAAGISATITGLNATDVTTGASDIADYTGATAGDTSPGNILISAQAAGVAAIPGVTTYKTYEWDTAGTTGLPGILRIAAGLPSFLAYWSENTDTFLDLIKAFSKFHQHTTAYQSHSFHNNYTQYTSIGTLFTTPISNISYIGDRIQEFGGITVNNLYRGSCVGLSTTASVPNPTQTDSSRNLMSRIFGNTNESNLGIQFEYGIASANYAALNTRIRNQYGQVDGIIQIPTGSCVQSYTINDITQLGDTSEVIFGGDIYIGRYTEKNTMFFFSDWMYDLPNDFEYDYRLRKMMPYPTYWMDTQDFQVNDFVQGMISMMLAASGPSSSIPSGFHNFDRSSITGSGNSILNLISQALTPTLIVSDAFMYLFNSGVRDFFVESEVNVEQRDWEDDEARRHYDPYLHTSYSDLFRTDIIKAGNFFKYDYSLSASRYYQGYPSWASMQYRNYDPDVAETCYTYYPNRVIYSLPSNKELRYDNWLTYLVNNYKDFTSRVTTIKPIGKNGAMMLFENEAPITFQGVDTLQTDGGTKITIGDGGLFSQPLQNIVNADNSYEYGSCQNRLSVVNTPAGLFWISQNQGKIFNYTGQLEDISQQGMKWWFEEFLPYAITEDFPTFELTDNTIIGVGCQAIYDNSDGIVYFTKRDFKLRPEFRGLINYVNEDNFATLNGAPIKLGDPRYFDDASWTTSYDPKSKAWVSFHDWHPNLLLPSKNHFMSILNDGIWKHNDRVDSYCNYYGVDYPFEVELVTPTGQNVNTLKSLEYILEVYVWDTNEIDKNHVLDFNFDRAVVYNTEQISGDLRLNLNPKSDPITALTYPIVNASNIDILYSKEEHKYRFNQFWDITDDRGEFTNARRMMWNTSPNGYTKTINPLYVNYNKSPEQRKKFRHYQSNLWLRRLVSGAHNMQLKLINTKNQYSPR